MTIGIDPGRGLHRINARTKQRELEVRAQTLGLEHVEEGRVAVPAGAPDLYTAVVDAALRNDSRGSVAGAPELEALEQVDLTFQNQALTLAARGLAGALRAEIKQLEMTSQFRSSSRVNTRLEHFTERLDTLYPRRSLASQEGDVTVAPLRDELHRLSTVAVDFVSAIAQHQASHPPIDTDEDRSIQYQLKSANAAGSVASVTAGILAGQPRSLRGPDWTQAVVGPFTDVDDHLITIKGGTSAEREVLERELPKAFAFTTAGRELANPDWLARLEASAREAGITIEYPASYSEGLRERMLQRADERIAEAQIASREGETPYATTAFALQRVEQLCAAANEAWDERYSPRETIGALDLAMRRQVDASVETAVETLQTCDTTFYEVGNAVRWLVMRGDYDPRARIDGLTIIVSAIETQLADDPTRHARACEAVVNALRPREG